MVQCDAVILLEPASDSSTPVCDSLGLRGVNLCMHEYLGGTMTWLDVPFQGGHTTYDLQLTRAGEYSRPTWRLADLSLNADRYLALQWQFQTGHSGWNGGNAEAVRGLVVIDLKEQCYVLDLVVLYAMEWWSNTLETPLTDTTTQEPVVIDSEGESVQEEIQVAFDGTKCTLTLVFAEQSIARSYRRKGSYWRPQRP